MNAHRHSWSRLVFAAAAFTVSCSTVPVAPPPREERVEEKPTVKEVISWQVSPAEGYADEYGFVRLDFTPPDGEAAPAPGGRLTVHLGRHSLAHADSAWYGIVIEEGKDVLLDFSGREGIPNVKGPDGNWWNDVLIDLSAPISREIGVTVSDRMTGVGYRFTVRRLVGSEEGP
jgi:hypothetical protein